jgi:hypothetical protein
MAKRILSLFRNLFRKRAIEQALDDELRSTLEALTQEKIEQGLSQSVARREAVIEIGGIEQVKEWSAHPFRTNGHFIVDSCTCGHIMIYDHEACRNAFAENRGTSRCTPANLCCWLRPH